MPLNMIDKFNWKPLHTAIWCVTSRVPGGTVCSLIECGPTEATNSHAQAQYTRPSLSAPGPNAKQSRGSSRGTAVTHCQPMGRHFYCAMLLMLLFMPYYSLIESKRAFEPNRGLVSLWCVTHLALHKRCWKGYTRARCEIFACVAQAWILSRLSLAGCWHGERETQRRSTLIDGRTSPVETSNALCVHVWDGDELGGAQPNDDDACKRCRCEFKLCW